MKYITAVLLLLIGISSCNRDEEILNNEDLLFTNSYPIRVPPYEFEDEGGNIYQVRGDTSYYSTYPDTLNCLPVMAWDSMGIKIITVAIFNDKIQVEGNQIANTDDIVWQWHSGMEGIEGWVQYRNGKNVINDTIDYNHQADSLDEGHYYWAVWGWGKSGIKVWYSSRELEFYVLK